MVASAIVTAGFRCAPLMRLDARTGAGDGDTPADRDDDPAGVLSFRSREDDVGDDAVAKQADVPSCRSLPRDRSDTARSISAFVWYTDYRCIIRLSMRNKTSIASELLPGTLEMLILKTLTRAAPRTLLRRRAVSRAERRPTCCR